MLPIRLANNKKMIIYILASKSILVSRTITSRTQCWFGCLARRYVKVLNENKYILVLANSIIKSMLVNSKKNILVQE